MVGAESGLLGGLSHLGLCRERWILGWAGAGAGRTWLLVGAAWTRGGEEEPPAHSSCSEACLVSSGDLVTLYVCLPSPVVQGRRREGPAVSVGLTLVSLQAAVPTAQPSHPDRRQQGQRLTPEAAGPKAAEAACGRHPPHREYQAHRPLLLFQGGRGGGRAVHSPGGRAGGTCSREKSPWRRGGSSLCPGPAPWEALGAGWALPWWPPTSASEPGAGS